MITKGFKELRVYSLAEEIADLIWDVAKTWDRFAMDTIGKQIVRSADSIGANIAEGCGRHSFADNRRFITYARGSLAETQHWLRRAYKRGLLTDAHVASLKPLIDQLGPKLNAYRVSIGKHLEGKPASNPSPRSAEG